MTHLDIDAEIARGATLIDEGRFDEARTTLEACDAALSSERSARRADVLVGLSRVARAESKLRDAVSLLDIALAMSPGNVRAVAERLVLARALEDPGNAAVLGLRAVNFATSDDRRLQILDGVVRDALATAASALRAALQIKRDDRALLEQMRALHEAAGNYVEAVNVAVAVAESITDRSERARAFVDAADLCAHKAGNVDRAVALYEAAIADDPAVPGAFEAIEQVLLDSGDVVGTERAYVRQLERLAGGERTEGRRVQLLQKLATIREDRLADLAGAAEALDRLLALRPRDVDARLRLAALLDGSGERALAMRCLEIGASIAPKHAATFRAMHRLAGSMGDSDRAYLAASVLVHHEEADPDEQALYRAHAPRVVLQPTRALDDVAFTMLAPEDNDPIVATIASAIADAAVAARIEQLRVSKLLPKVDPRERQGVDKTTVSAVRTVGWATRFFGMRTPHVLVRPGEASGLAHVPAPEPTFALGDGVLTGRSIPELAYLLGYELAYMRAAGRMVAFYPNLNELKALIVAAIASVLPSPLPNDVANIRDALSSRLDAVQRLRLQNAVRALSDRGGQLDVVVWIRALERTACRAGLLACGDVNVASRVLAIDGRTIGGLTAADRVRDLIAFSVSEPYARVRAAVGVAV